MNRWHRDTHDAQLRRLSSVRPALSCAQIGAIMGFSESTVSKHRFRLCLYTQKIRVPKREQTFILDEDKPNVVTLAKRLFSIAERNGLYWFRGRPIGLLEMARMVNRERKKLGLPQVVHDERWRV